MVYVFNLNWKAKLRSINKDKIHKILVVRTDRIGEALLNLPAIRALKKSFKAYLVALVSPSVKELLEGSPEIDELIVYDRTNYDKHILTRLGLLFKLRKKKFDLAVILNPTKRFHILSYLAGIPLRLGYARKWGFLLTHKIKDKKFLGQKHEVEYNLDLVRSIGADTNDRHISIKISQQDNQSITELLQRYGIKEKDLIIAFHPYASNPAKCWPENNFAVICDRIYSQFNAKVIIVGGKQEQKLVLELISLTKSTPINLAGQLTLKQLACLFQRSVLFISNDSGPVHIAAAMDTPCLVIFSRNIPGVGPKRWGPWGNGHTILHKDPGCNPCLDRNCPFDFKCLTLITSEEVLQAVEQRLARSSKFIA